MNVTMHNLARICSWLVKDCKEGSNCLYTSQLVQSYGIVILTFSSNSINVKYNNKKYSFRFSIRKNKVTSWSEFHSGKHGYLGYVAPKDYFR